MIEDINMNTWLMTAVIGYGIKLLFEFLTRDRYKVKPNISREAWLANLILWPRFIFQTREEYKPFNFERMKAKAIKKVGYDDFGDWDERPFKETIECVNKTDYSYLGRAICYDFFVRRMMTTLRIREVFSKDKELNKYCENGNNPVRRPIFVLGLPRTGTSYLHKLLAMDPNARAPYAWELVDPVPRIPDDPEKDKAKRIKFLQTNMDNLNKVAPQILQSHELCATNPEECIAAMANDVPILFETFHCLINYADVVEGWASADCFRKAYKNYSKFLQYLDYQAMKIDGDGNGTDKPERPKRWVLKCPIHLGALDFIHEVFPDADIVWTHRTQENVMLSFCDLIRADADLFLKKEVDLKAIGNGVIDYTTRMYRRADDFLTRHPQDTTKHHFVDVKYDQLIPEPIKMVQSIYQQLGYEFTDEYRLILEDFLVKDAEYRKNLRKTDNRIPNTLETYGLSKSIIDEKFDWYVKKYAK